MKIKCTCTLQEGPADTMPPELHDEDCMLYLRALANDLAEEKRAIEEDKRWGG